ncbi:hypothetical protein AABB24_033095 [Solanum stoloniferum]|uniref:Uncharacterized protein n=1 Tax=Solanum stoloniferum TaxID=62892 RepID=A0ABD2RPP6_9SOLN
MSQHDQVPCFCTRTLPPDTALLNRLQHLLPVDYSFMSRFKFEHSNLGDIIYEIEEEEEAEELSDKEIMEEDEQEVEEAVNKLILDEETMEEDAQEVEEAVNVLILLEKIGWVLGYGADSWVMG